MVRIFYGSDTVAVRQAAFSYIGEQETAGKSVGLIDSDSYVSGTITDAAGASSLFGTQTIYVLDTAGGSRGFRDDVLASLELLGESVNEFVVIEGALLAAEKKRYSKFAKSMEERRGKPGERFNTFALAEALARKDKKSLWLLLHDARRAGISEEEMIGVLWWQLKSLQLAKLTSSASEAGMKDFPYGKAKRALGTFAEGEVEQLSLSLLTFYHEARAGEVELGNALERWTLTL